MQYRIYDLVIQSDQPLPELAQCEAQHTDLQIQWLPAVSQLRAVSTWRHHWTEADETQLSIAKTRTGWLFRFPEQSDFAINAGGDQITVTARKDTDASTLRHQLLDQVLPRLMSLRGRISLHASAVQSPHGSLLFVGQSGAGKSSIGTYLHQQGWPLLCDDSVILQHTHDTIEVLPAYPGARLYPDSPIAARLAIRPSQPAIASSGKLRFALGASNNGQAQALAHILLLPGTPASQATTPLLNPVTGTEAVIALLDASFQFDVSDHDHMSRYFGALGSLLNQGVAVSRLAYRHDAACLRELEIALTAPGQAAPSGQVSA